MVLCVDKNIKTTIIEPSYRIADHILIYYRNADHIFTYIIVLICRDILQIGNAVINDETDIRGMYDYFGTHALISDETTKNIQTYCNFSSNDNNQSNECDAASAEVNKDIAYINIYNIYAPSCFHKSTTTKPKKPSVS